MLKRFVDSNRKLSVYVARRWPHIFGGDNCTQELLSRIHNHIEVARPKRIIECGGIDRPLLKKSSDYFYIGLDIEDKEGCYAVYDEFYVQSVEDTFAEKADMVITITLLEHVRNNRAAVKEIYSALLPNGTTHHYVPSKYHPYSVILRLVGPKMQKKLIHILRPDASEITGYPAFFDFCSPAQMRQLFVENGFGNIDVQPFYRANDYFEFFFPAYLMITIFENVCRAMKWQLFCSGFIISGRKNEI